MLFELLLFLFLVCTRQNPLVIERYFCICASGSCPGIRSTPYSDEYLLIVLQPLGASKSLPRMWQNRLFQYWHIRDSCLKPSLWFLVWVPAVPSFVSESDSRFFKTFSLLVSRRMRSWVTQNEISFVGRRLIRVSKVKLKFFSSFLSGSLSIKAAACLGKLWPQFEEKESSHAASLEKEREILEEASVPYFSSSSSAEIFSQGNCSY